MTQSRDRNSNDKHSNGKRPQIRSTSRKVPAPALKAPGTERGLTHSPYFNGALYERMSEDLHLGGMSKRTHEGYLRAVRQLADFCKRSPDQITEDQLRKFFLHLKNHKAFASGSLRVAFSGVKFFYTRTCKRNWQTLAQMRIKDDKTLPEATLKLLREFWKTHQHRTFLFPADGRNHRGVSHVRGISTASTPMSPTAVQDAMKLITRQINFAKKVSTHTLRHSYATHLLEAGVSLRQIQQFLGHSSLQTTMVSLHLTDTQVADARKVIDSLFRRPR